MNTRERFEAAYTGLATDRVPVCAWLGMPLLRQLTGHGPRAILEELVENPLEMVRIQEDLGLDPVLVTPDERRFSMHRYPRLLYSWPEEALETWHVREEVQKDGHNFRTHRYTATTPEGPVTWSYRMGDGQVAEVEPAVKNERDLDLCIRYLPEPESLNQDKLKAMVDTAGDRAFFMHCFIGVWGEAANMRGLVTLACDLIDQPKFVEKFSEFLRDRAIRRVRHLAATGVHSILYDQSWVGIGFSPEQFRRFMYPYDTAVVEAAKEAGFLVSYHNCGCGQAFIEEMADTGAHSLETLTPKTSSGDFDLAESKRRVGDRITLNGGFNERILPEGRPGEVRDEVRRCIDAAGAGGRYVLRSTGQVMDSAPGNLQLFAEAGKEFGSY